jgi:ketosteroid isomerase-like protein
VSLRRLRRLVQKAHRVLMPPMEDQAHPLGRARDGIPPQSLELVGEVFARLESDDHEAVEELCHENLEVRWRGVGLRHHDHRGAGALTSHLREMGRIWERVDVVCDRLADRPGRVLALYRLLGRGADGSTAESPHAAVVRIRDARVWRWDAFQDAAHSFDWLASESRLI